jgi:hypothetical protein
VNNPLKEDTGVMTREDQERTLAFFVRELQGGMSIGKLPVFPQKIFK